MFRVLRDYVFDGVARLLGLPLPEEGDEAATKDYVDGVLAGASNFKDPCQARTAANIDISVPGATLDNRTMLSGDRVLVSKQTDTSENGIYDWTGAAVPLTRSSDCNSAAELNAALVTIDGVDSDYFALTYRQTLTVTTLETDPVKWVFFGQKPPQATETEKGIAEIATQGEVDTATDHTRIVTPLTLGVTVAAMIDEALDDFAIGAGAVNSVNGMAGTVVLDAADVGADAAGSAAMAQLAAEATAAAALAAHAADPDAHGDFLTQTEADALYEPIGGSATRYTKAATFQMTDGSEIALSGELSSGVQVLQDAGTVVRWSIVGEGGTGSCTIGVRACSFASGPPDSGDSITGGNNPAISSATQDDDTTLTSWTPAITAGHQLALVLLTCTGFSRVTITLEIERT